jgi:fluoroacetyl-CoA thioesterase
MKRSAKPKKRITRASGAKLAKPAKIAHSTAARPAKYAPELNVPGPRIGLEAAIEKIIPHEWTLASFDPRLPPVLSTPAMIGMMEVAAAEAVRPELPPGSITVGTRIEVDHLKAVTEGASVRVTARLVKHEGRFLVFDVEARSGELLLGRGKVSRAIVEPQKFGARATAQNNS